LKKEENGTKEKATNEKATNDAGKSSAMESVLKDTTKSFQSTFDEVKQDLLAVEKSLKTAIIVKAIMLLIVIIYMSWLYGSIKKIDAEAIVSTVKQQFLAQTLPTMSKEIARDLKASAPSTIEDTKKQIDQMIPELRVHLQAKALDETQKLTDSIAADVDTIVADYVVNHAEDIKKRKPNATDLERAKDLFQMMRADFKKMVMKAANKHIDEYNKDVKKLHIDLKKLRTSRNLTGKEKLQRKIIAIWVKLLKIEQKKMPSADQDVFPEKK